MSKLKRSVEELEAERNARRERTLANQRRMISYIRRVKETSANDIRVHLGSVDGLKELIAANILQRDKFFTITLARDKDVKK